MSKGNNLPSLFCGILFCISVAALVIACLAFTKKGGGKGEYYKGESSDPVCVKNLFKCIRAAANDAAYAPSPPPPPSSSYRWTAFNNAFDYSADAQMPAACKQLLSHSPSPTP